MLNKYKYFAVLILFLHILSVLCGCTGRWYDGADAAAETTGFREGSINESADYDYPSERHDVRDENDFEIQQQSIAVLFYADTQADPDLNDYASLGLLMERAYALHGMPDIVVFGGDTVNDGGDGGEWLEFRRVIDPWIDGAITAAVAGNHDSYPLLAEQFDYPAEAPSSMGRGFFYTISVGPLFFVMLDSNIMGAANRADIEWLQDALQSEAASQADWIIAVMHHPMWTVTDNPRDISRAETMREFFLPLLETHGAALILCGHQHVYARTFPMHGYEAADDGDGIIQIMVASGDKAAYAPGERDYLAASANMRSYLLLFVDSESISVMAYDDNGDIFDEVVIRKVAAAQTS